MVSVSRVALVRTGIAAGLVLAWTWWNLFEVAVVLILVWVLGIAVVDWVRLGVWTK
jgi:hypothetical protein